jgi:predicted metalloprotease
MLAPRSLSIAGSPEEALDTALEDIQDRRSYERLIGAAVVSIDDFWGRALLEVYGIRYERPTIRGGYDPEKDSVTCGGEESSLVGNAFYCPSDDFIAWDDPTFFYERYEQQAQLAPVFILAHEWGHAIQNRLGARFERDIQAELGADCLAGAWAQYAARAPGTIALTREDFDRALETLVAGQDEDNVPWFTENAHGTAFERNDAFSTGVREGPAGCIQPANHRPVPFRR